MVGSYHGIGDPAPTVQALGPSRAWLVWVPGLVLYVALFPPMVLRTVDAFREQFGSRNRRHAVAQALRTAGVAALLYAASSLVENRFRTDLRFEQTLTEKARAEAQRRAAAAYLMEARRLGKLPPRERLQQLEKEMRPFPVAWPLAAFSVAMIGAAFLRRFGPVAGPHPLPVSLLRAIWIAAAAVGALLSVLIRLGR